MARGKQSDEDRPVTRRPPAATPEDREDQLILAAMNLAEQQILAGTASSQVISHFLKLGSSRERLEQARLKGEVDLVGAKVEQIASGARIEELYQKAITAMRTYAGDDAADL